MSLATLFLLLLLENCPLILTCPTVLEHLEKGEGGDVDLLGRVDGRRVRGRGRPAHPAHSRPTQPQQPIHSVCVLQ